MMEHVFPGDQWQTKSPGEVGFDGERLASVEIALKESAHKPFRFAIARYGYLIAESTVDVAIPSASVMIPVSAYTGRLKSARRANRMSVIRSFMAQGFHGIDVSRTPSGEIARGGGNHDEDDGGAGECYDVTRRDFV